MYDLNNPQLQLEPFFIEFGCCYLHGDIIPKDANLPPAILCLHGLGKEGRQGFLLLRQILHEKYNLSSCAFDFIDGGSASGETCGLYCDGQEPVNQASDIIDACFDSKSFSIIAADVSAMTALQVVTMFPVRQLVLLNPPEGLQEGGHAPLSRVVMMPVEASQTLTYLNANPAMLLKVAALLGQCDKATYLEPFHKEYFA